MFSNNTIRHLQARMDELEEKIYALEKARVFVPLEKANPRIGVQESLSLGEALQMVIDSLDLRYVEKKVEAARMVMGDAADT